MSCMKETHPSRKTGGSSGTIQLRKTNQEGNRHCTMITLGTGKVGNIFRLKYPKGKRYNAPYIRLTCLNDDIPEGHKCYVTEVAYELEKIRKTVCLPARVFVDIMHIMETGDVDLAGKNHDMVIYDITQEKQNKAYSKSTMCIYELDKRHKLGPLKTRPPAIGSVNAEHEDCPQISGGWGIRSYKRGGMFLFSWEGKSIDNGLHIFPLCHSEHVYAFFAAVDHWLKADYKTGELLIECRVPDQMTLFPMPHSEDHYRYSAYTLENFWPEMSDQELQGMLTVSRRRVYHSADDNEDPNTNFSDADNQSLTDDDDYYDADDEDDNEEDDEDEEDNDEEDDDEEDDDEDEDDDNDDDD